MSPTHSKFFVHFPIIPCKHISKHHQNKSSLTQKKIIQSLFIIILIINFTHSFSWAQDNSYSIPPVEIENSDLNQIIPDPPPINNINKNSKINIALTVGGGVSLGSYQSGLLYYLVEFLRTPEAREYFNFNVVTGASAGTINVLLSLMSYCMDNTTYKNYQTPEQSLLYKSWIDISYEKLKNNNKNNKNSIFDQKKIKDKIFQENSQNPEDTIEFIWGKLVQENLCQQGPYVLGATVTHTESREINNETSGINFVSQSEKFILDITNFNITNFNINNSIYNQCNTKNQTLPENIIKPQAFLNLNNQQDYNFKQLSTLILASSAFPVAFAPVEIEFCYAQPNKNLPIKQNFMDGGVFDNDPVRLAYQIENNIYKNSSFNDTYYIYLNKDNTKYYKSHQQSNKDNLFNDINNLISGVIDNSTSHEWQSLAENSEVFYSLVQTQRYYPTASGHLINFLGFFEKSFRDFDFYLGMYDGDQLVKQIIAKTEKNQTQLKNTDISLAAPNKISLEKLKTAQLSLNNKNSIKFKCISNFLDYQNTDDCKEYLQKDINDSPEEKENFLTLLYVSTETLWHDLQLNPNKQNLNHSHPLLNSTGKVKCKESILDIHFGDLKYNFSGSDICEDYLNEQEPWEGNQACFFKRLSFHGFNFLDISLHKENSSYAHVKIFRELIDDLEFLGDNQKNYAHTTALHIGGKYAINQILTYTPPQNFLHIGFGDIFELGFNTTLSDDPDWAYHGWIIFNSLLNLGPSNIQKIIDNRNNSSNFLDQAVSTSASLTIGYEKQFYANPTLQIFAGLSPGFRLSLNDFNFANRNPQEKCNTYIFRQNSFNCSSPILNFHTKFTLIDRFYIKNLLEYSSTTEYARNPGHDQFDIERFSLKTIFGFNFLGPW